MATSSGAKVSLKLLIDTKAKRVLFAEAGKDFVDFLFNLLHLPVGTVVRLLTEQTMVGTLGNLYQSIQNLGETYFLSNQTKDSVLKPKAPFSATQVPLLSLEGGPSSAKKCYICPNRCNNEYSENACAICRNCNRSFSREMEYVAAANEVGAVGEGGFVKGVVTYMVMDDLVVTPMSTISGITMLNKFNVKEVGALEEMVVDVGMPEGLKLRRQVCERRRFSQVCSRKHWGVMVDRYFYWMPNILIKVLPVVFVFWMVFVFPPFVLLGGDGGHLLFCPNYVRQI